MSGDTIGQDQRVITHQKLLAAAGEFDVESILLLNLSNSRIEDISALEGCFSLTRLDLRCNDISVLKPLKNLRALTTLNLSANRITNIDVLGCLENLTELNLAGNLIGSFDRLRCLQSLEHLQKLRFSDMVKKLSNPICHNISYEERVMQLVPNLLMLDGMKLKGYGSELYKICKDLDDQIKNLRGEACSSHGDYCACGACSQDHEEGDERTFGPVEERPVPGAWLRPGYFSLPPHNNTEDYATTEFKETIKQCKELNCTAKEYIEAMRK